MKIELAEYGKTIRKAGWRAGEPLVARGELRWPGVFKQWAHALGIMLRAIELLEEEK